MVAALATLQKGLDLQGLYHSTLFTKSGYGIELTRAESAGLLPGCQRQYRRCPIQNDK